jgi:hypothetical protein
VLSSMNCARSCRSRRSCAVRAVSASALRAATRVLAGRVVRYTRRGAFSSTHQRRTSWPPLAPHSRHTWRASDVRACSCTRAARACLTLSSIRLHASVEAARSLRGSSASARLSCRFCAPRGAEEDSVRVWPLRFRTMRVVRPRAEAASAVAGTLP